MAAGAPTEIPPSAKVNHPDSSPLDLITHAFFRVTWNHLSMWETFQRAELHEKVIPQIN